MLQLSSVWLDKMATSSFLGRLPKSWISLAIRVLSVGLLFLFNVFLARWLGAEQYGHYALIVVWVNLAVLLVKGGLDTAALRFIPAYKVSNGNSSIRGFLSFSLLWIAGWSLGVFLIASLVHWYRPFLPSGVPLWGVGLLVLFLALSQLRRTVLLSYRRLVLAELPESILKPLIFLVLAAAAMLAGNQGSVVEAVHISWGLTLIGLLMGGMVLWRLIGVDIQDARPNYEARIWLGASLIMLLNTGLHQVIKSFDILILGGFRGATEVAAYSAASRVADLVVFGLSSLNLMVAPKISALYTAGDFDALRRMLRKTAWFVFLFAVGVFLVFCLVGEWLLGIYGSSFRSGFSALIILAAAQVFNSSTGSVGFLLSMTGRHKVALLIMLISAALSVPLYYLLIPLYGGVGAAVASAVGIVVWNLLMLLYACLKVGINPSIYSFVPVRDLRK